MSNVRVFPPSRASALANEWQVRYLCCGEVEYFPNVGQVRETRLIIDRVAALHVCGLDVPDEAPQISSYHEGYAGRGDWTNGFALAA